MSPHLRGEVVTLVSLASRASCCERYTHLEMRYRRGILSEKRVRRERETYATGLLPFLLLLHQPGDMPPRPRLQPWIAPARHLHASSAVRLPPPLPATVAASLAAASSSQGPAQDTLSGWIRSVRRQKNVSFAVLSDGSQVGGVQVVLPKGLDEE